MAATFADIILVTAAVLWVAVLVFIAVSHRWSRHAAAWAGLCAVMVVASVWSPPLFSAAPRGLWLACACTVVACVGIDTLRMHMRTGKWVASAMVAVPVCITCAVTDFWVTQFVVAGAASAAGVAGAWGVMTLSKPAWPCYDVRRQCAVARMLWMVLVTVGAQAGAVFTRHAATTSGHGALLIVWNVYALTAVMVAAARDSDEDALDRAAVRSPEARGTFAASPSANDNAAGTPRLSMLLLFNAHGMPIAAPRLMQRPPLWHAAIEHVTRATQRLAGLRNDAVRPAFAVVCMQEIWAHRGGLAWPILELAACLQVPLVTKISQIVATVLGYTMPYVIWDGKLAMLRNRLWCRSRPKFGLHPRLPSRDRDTTTFPRLDDDGGLDGPAVIGRDLGKDLFSYTVGLRGHSMSWNPIVLIDSGLMICTTHRVSDAGFVPYSRRAGWPERSANKGMMWAYWAPPLHTLLVNTHLTGSAPPGTDRAQIEELGLVTRQLMAWFGRQDGPGGGAAMDAYIAGDFNYSLPNHPDFDLLKPEFTRITDPAFGTVDPPANKCVDYAYYCRYVPSKHDNHGAAWDTTDTVSAAQAFECLQPAWAGYFDLVSDHAISRVINTRRRVRPAAAQDAEQPGPA